MFEKEIEFDMVTTKGGDKGESFLYDGTKRRKDDFLFETVGDLDELNSFLGIVRAKTGLKEIQQIQQNILVIGSMVATPVNSEQYKEIPKFDEREITKIEKIEKKLLKKTSIKPVFVTPGENEIAAYIDIARSITRRCERRIVKVIRDLHLFDLKECQIYINRLSDYLFVLARKHEQE